MGGGLYKVSRKKYIAQNLFPSALRAKGSYMEGVHTGEGGNSAVILDKRCLAPRA